MLKIIKDVCLIISTALAVHSIGLDVYRAERGPRQIILILLVLLIGCFFTFEYFGELINTIRVLQWKQNRYDEWDTSFASSSGNQLEHNHATPWAPDCPACPVCDPDGNQGQ